MQKAVLSAILCVSLVAVGCSQKLTTYLPLTTTPENMKCVAAVKAYIDNADTKGSGPVIKQGDKLVVDYIGRLEDGTVFDTSVESVAQACGKFSAQRNYTEGLPFTVGAGQMIAGFDKGVLGMKQGQTKIVKIPAVEAYGARDKANLIPFPKASFSGSDTLQAGQQVMTSLGQALTVYEITGDQIILDANPPLAGKDLIFDITIKKVN